jgi:hypothetical protein
VLVTFALEVFMSESSDKKSVTVKTGSLTPENLQTPHAQEDDVKADEIRLEWKTKSSLRAGLQAAHHFC